jgi:hypothetical protein
LLPSDGCLSSAAAAATVAAAADAAQPLRSTRKLMGANTAQNAVQAQAQAQAAAPAATTKQASAVAVASTNQDGQMYQVRYITAHQ